MPSLARITNTFFVNLINRLGVRPPPDEGFLLTNIVQPVSIVDQEATFQVSSAPALYGTPASIGRSAAPALNTVLADSGALAVGAFNCKVVVDWFDQVNNVEIGIQHRDAANAANIWERRLFTSTATGQTGAIVFEFADTFLVNERLRVIVLVAGGAGSIYQAEVFTIAR